MNPVYFAWYVRKRTNTNSTTLPDDDIKKWMKITKDDELVQEVMKIDEKVFTTPATDNLVADQREYPFIDDILSRLHRVEAKLDGENFIKLESMDIKDWDKPLIESSITNYFSNNEGDAFYDIIRKGIYIFSGTITDVTDGLKVWYETFPADVTDLTATDDMSEDPSATEHGMPRELHRVWGDMVVKAWKEAQPTAIPLSKREENLEFHLKNAVESLKHQDLNEVQFGKVPKGENVWNDGYNL